MKARVHVTLKNGVLDPQGKAIGNALHRLGFPEVGLGVIPGMGGTQRLIGRVGLARARELIYTAAVIDADGNLYAGLLGGPEGTDQGGLIAFGP